MEIEVFWKPGYTSPLAEELYLSQSRIANHRGPPQEDLRDVPGCKCLKGLVGLAGFEPTTSCTPSKRASQAAPQPEPL